MISSVYLKSQSINKESFPVANKGSFPFSSSEIFNAVILAPFLEELIFTYGINNILGPKYGPAITPVLFGAAHFHKGETLSEGTIIAATAGLGSFLRTRNFHATPKHTLAPIFAHSIYNGALVGIAGLTYYLSKK